ncbi:MAG: T9SS type A sorting domain-containing protein [Bacteroidetes bacterium]|nr:T9SS type A sorting domain-containing protein [Bacteroidota bacterium]
MENPNTPAFSVNLYPNPCNDFIVLNGTIKYKTISIYDINGRLIREIYSDDIHTRINTSTLKQGFYLLRYFDGRNTLR